MCTSVHIVKYRIGIDRYRQRVRRCRYRCLMQTCMSAPDIGSDMSDIGPDVASTSDPTLTDISRHWPTLAEFGGHWGTLTDIGRHFPTLADMGRHWPTFSHRLPKAARSSKPPRTSKASTRPPKSLIGSLMLPKAPKDFRNAPMGSEKLSGALRVSQRAPRGSHWPTLAEIV